MGVYAITNMVNGKMYVGSARDIQARWRGHTCELRKDTHHSSHLQRAWNKYGEDNFTLQILEIVKDVKAVREAEQRWIDFLAVYGTNEGYNAHPYAIGGRLVGWHHSEATLKKLRESNASRGEANVNAKLTAEDVREICKRLNADESALSIAKDFGVTPNNIAAIRSGKTWRHISASLLVSSRKGYRAGARHGMSKLTETDVDAIKRRLAMKPGKRIGESMEDIAKDFGVSRRAVSHIARGDRWQSSQKE